MQEAMEKDERVVEEVFQIDTDELYLMESKGNYWKWAQDFWKDVKGQKMHQMSEKQLKQLRRIKNGVEEESSK